MTEDHNQKNVVSLVPRPERGLEPSQAVIEFLEDALERAKTGELQAIAGACLFDDGCAYHVLGWAGSFEMMGALSMAAHSLAEAGRDFEEA